MGNRTVKRPADSRGTLAKTGYAAVRLVKDESREWLDVASFEFTAEGVERLVRTLDQNIPQWAKANPVVRIARVRIEEIDVA